MRSNYWFLVEVSGVPQRYVHEQVRLLAGKVQGIEGENWDKERQKSSFETTCLELLGDPNELAQGIATAIVEEFSYLRVSVTTYQREERRISVTTKEGAPPNCPPGAFYMRQVEGEDGPYMVYGEVFELRGLTGAPELPDPEFRVVQTWSRNCPAVGIWGVEHPVNMTRVTRTQFLRGLQEVRRKS